MKVHVYLLALMAAVSSAAPAQGIPAQSIRDSLIGWMKVFKFTVFDPR